MKIIHFLRDIDLRQGGVVRAVLDIATVLSARGHEIVVACCDDRDVPDAWRSGERSVPRVLRLEKRRGPLPTLPSSSARRLEEEAENAEAVHLHTPWEIANLQIGRLARRRGTPYFVSVHGMLDDWSMSQSSIRKRVFLAGGGRRMLEAAAGVHCTAEHERTQAKEWFPNGNAVVIPLVFDLAPFRSLPGPDLARRAFVDAEGGDPIILFLSRLHPKKGVELFIDAIAALLSRGVKCRGLVAGAGTHEYEQRLRRQVERSGLESQVRFVGLVGGEEKISLYQRASLFLLPTSQENFGFVLPESLASGTPVITTRGVDIWPELEKSGGARIVDRDAERLADVAAELLDDPEQISEMGARGREWVFAELDPERVAARYEALYENSGRMS